jgi:hypothetical protein
MTNMGKIHAARRQTPADIDMLGCGRFLPIRLIVFEAKCFGK